MIWMHQTSNDPLYLVFAEYIEDEGEAEKEKGRVQVTAERVQKIRA